jgi:type I restriction-modification system DNA methylase subunit
MAENTMFEYGEFVDNLKIELNSYKSTPIGLWIETASRYVNGFAEEEVRRLVPLEKRRNDGVFFTDSLLAEKVLEVLQPCFNEQSVIYDAACGVGNLLIAAATYLHKHNIQPDNKKYLLGTDIHIEFVQAANLRLQMNNLLLLPEKTTNVSQQKKGYFIHQRNALIANKSTIRPRKS